MRRIQLTTHMIMIMMSHLLVPRYGTLTSNIVCGYSMLYCQYTVFPRIVAGASISKLIFSDQEKLVPGLKLAH